MKYAIIIIIAITQIACQKLDIVANHAIQSFDEIIKNTSKNIAQDDENTVWTYTTPDSTAIFGWGNKLFIKVDATPFIEAGLKTEQLPQTITYNETENTLTIKYEIDKTNHSLAQNPINAMEQIVRNNRRTIGYHRDGGHFGFDLQNENMLHYAKNIYEHPNPNHIAFMINAKPLTDAGTIPENVKGWVYREVESHANRKKTPVLKFVKGITISLLNQRKPTITDTDLIIQIADITENALYYPVTIEDTTIEVIAVRAPDGSIKTTLNTCQACYRSGKGYFVQNDSVMVCQNCNMRYRMNQLERENGGCNPVPIFPENKTITENTITISKEFLKTYKRMFEYQSL